MESKHPENEKLSPDDSQTTEQAASEVEKKDQGFEPEPAVREGEPDFDVRPADTYLGPDYDPKKASKPMTLWLGVLMVAAIIGLTYYAFKGQSVPEQGPEAAGGQTVSSVPAPDTAAEPQRPSLPEKAPDAADFSPTPEMEAAAAPASLPATTSSSTPTAPPAATVPPSDSAKAGTAKTAAQKTKKDEAKPAATAAKPADTKPAATAAKPADTKPAATTAKPADTKPAATATKPADTKPAETTTKPEESKPAVAEAKNSEAEPADDATSTVSGEGPKTDEAKADAASAPAAAEISDLWVVNISSTPDAAESLRLLKRVSATDVGGQVYFYETTIDGRVQHRIRVGFFKSRSDAEAVGQKVKEAFQLSATPWAVKPTVEEVERYKK